MPDNDIFPILERWLPDSGGQIAVACSGGSDSMALALLADSWAKARGTRLVALTVDHGLRKESAEEALQVGAWLEKRGILHVILRWEGDKPVSNVQEAARNARYGLMADYCKQQGIVHVLVAHTLDDQAETFLLRLKRGSGVDGLSAMAEQTDLYGITVIRPLLGVRKAVLIDYLHEKQQPFISDPSNANTAYDRVKIRQLLPELKKIGILPETLAATAGRMARARDYLQGQTDDFIRTNAEISPMGYVILKSLPDAAEIAFRVLSRILMVIGGHSVPPRFSELEPLYHGIVEDGFTGRTLGGCIFKASKQGLLVLREPEAVAPDLLITCGGSYGWDRRFTVEVPSSCGNLTLGALTQPGWLEIARKHALCNTVPDKKTLYTLPALRDESGDIVSVPHLKIGVPCNVTGSCSLT